jgi:gluconate kinase
MSIRTPAAVSSVQYGVGARCDSPDRNHPQANQSRQSTEGPHAFQLTSAVHFNLGNDADRRGIWLHAYRRKHERASAPPILILTQSNLKSDYKTLLQKQITRVQIR